MIKNSVSAHHPISPRGFLTPFFKPVSWLVSAGFLLFMAGFFWACEPDQLSASPKTTLEPHTTAEKTTATAAQESPVETALIVFGDSGSGASMQYDLAKRMLAEYEKQPFQSALILGDLIYPDGDVKQFGEARFKKPYQPLLEKGVRFYTALGNHDVLSGHDNEVMAFFGMSGRYYRFTQGPVEFFAIDTNTFDKKKQQEWLEDALSKSQTSSRAPWKIVFGHHPIYSSGEHGVNKMLLAHLKPILEKHGVQLYLAGHDHDYERFDPVNGVTHIVSGGGGAYLREFDAILPGSRVHFSKHHFLRIDADEERLRFQVIGTDGAILDEWELTRP